MEVDWAVETLPIKNSVTDETVLAYMRSIPKFVGAFHTATMFMRNSAILGIFNIH